MIIYIFKRFLLPLQDCEFTLNSILDDLTVDPWFVPSDERPKRATGMALNIAISLLEAC
jgi:protein transport protein SEC23